MAATLTSDCSIALPKASVHADERVPSRRRITPEAVRMLMGLNRQVYFECPVLPTLGQKIRAALHLHTA